MGQQLKSDIFLFAAALFAGAMVLGANTSLADIIDAVRAFH